MKGKSAKNKNNKINDYTKYYLATEDELNSNEYPCLDNISSAMIFQFMPRPKKPKSPEFVYIKVDLKVKLKEDENTKTLNRIAEWNLAWEAAQLRSEMFGADLPNRLKFLEKFPDQNIYLLPKIRNHRYYSYLPLFHLLPLNILKKFGLPLLTKGIWPFIMERGRIDELLPIDFDQRLSQALAFYLWPKLRLGSPISAFSSLDPIKILAHNLDYWLPHIYKVAEQRLIDLGRVSFENAKQELTLMEARKEGSEDIELNRPLFGGKIWMGEGEANEATKEMIEYADSEGKLRSIIETVRSHRIKDDFSNRWSYAKEDFERKVYNKRSKVKVTFVELDNTIPVHGPDSEIEENMLWEDFLALLDVKERQIVVCIRNGITKVSEISHILGYANHSPISKALKKIREKAIKLLND